MRNNENNQEIPNVIKYLTTKQAAEMLGFTQRGLDNLRCRRLGPPFYRVNGRSIRYRLSDVIAWAESSRVETEIGGAE